MARKAPTAPKGKYHIEGLRILRTLVKDFRERASREDLGERSFLDQVRLAGVAHIPHNHDKWRKTIRQGMRVFNRSEDPDVQKTLLALIAGEKAARAKRKAGTTQTTATTSSVPSSAEAEACDTQRPRDAHSGEAAWAHLDQAPPMAGEGAGAARPVTNAEITGKLLE